MTLFLYNKPLLRVLVVLAGLGVGLAAWHYTALSFAKLGPGGIRDALAIVSFLVAGWLMLVVAEVVDNHYVRAFAALCTGLGGYVSFKWIFFVDGPKLAELPHSATGLRFIFWGFWAAMASALIILTLVVARLIVHRLTYGRGLIKPGDKDQVLASSSQAIPSSSIEPELPPIPQDLSAPKPQTGSMADASPVRQVGPVTKLTGIGGMYLGLEYQLSPGDHTIGRQDSQLLLADDPQVSRRHAMLTVKEDGLSTLVDAGSTNGTFVNNQRIDTYELAPGDVIRIGTTLFKVEV